MPSLLTAKYLSNIKIQLIRYKCTHLCKHLISSLFNENVRQRAKPAVNLK